LPGAQTSELGHNHLCSSYLKQADFESLFTSL
jgi:hypothetical protein